ncbi:MAG: hypothetical protein RIE73_00805 [Coleofasciculus sp. C1-SOL-03]|uniref:hypothetical protein n=1 Tax=Coleofasciculus sp. C1-SOL-03 TaxID=3069522 RepID=UPI0032FB6F2D
MVSDKRAWGGYHKRVRFRVKSRSPSAVAKLIAFPPATRQTSNPTAFQVSGKVAIAS